MGFGMCGTASVSVSFKTKLTMYNTGLKAPHGVKYLILACKVRGLGARRVQAPPPPQSLKPLSWGFFSDHAPY